VKTFPGSFFLTAADLPALAAYLAAQGWLDTGERLQQVERAGEGNMNCVLRVVTSARSFILKQSRPWVEKYPSIAAPWDRALVEAAFYREVQTDRSVAGYLPKLLAFDPAARLLMLENLGGAPDFTFIYSPAAAIFDTDLISLTEFLIALHGSFRNPALAATFANSEMRALNHEHIFALPLRENNGLSLENITPGLSRLARRLQQDDVYCSAVGALGERYLNHSEGSCLLHGDYFPGSWLKFRQRVYVIDPEFCFFGPPEWDLGVMTAHLYLADQPSALISKVAGIYSRAVLINPNLAAQFAGVEIMRRLIGVAQLPVSLNLEQKSALLDLSRTLVLEQGLA
jgi:5-methylthioribose kinase